MKYNIGDMVKFNYEGFFSEGIIIATPETYIPHDIEKDSKWSVIVKTDHPNAWPVDQTDVTSSLGALEMGSGYLYLYDEDVIITLTEPEFPSKYIINKLRAELNCDCGCIDSANANNLSTSELYYIHEIKY